MGATVSVKNETPYTWYYSRSSSEGFQSVYPGSRAEYSEHLAIHCYIYLRYEGHSFNSFEYEFNSHKGKYNIVFTLKESCDRSQIQLHCDTENNVPLCTNYGKIEEDRREQEREQERRRQEERRRQQEEEKRRLERLERERRIQEEIDRESDISREKLSKAKEKLRQKQSYKGQERHHQRIHSLHQVIEDDAAAIERDEFVDVEQKFKELMSKYHIIEKDDLPPNKLEDRMKTLHNELTLTYCKENKLSILSQFTFDQVVGYEELSLTERLSILEAVVRLAVVGNEDDNALEWDKKYDFLFHLVEQLQITNPTLARHILLKTLDAVSELLPQTRESLSQILFSNIWTSKEVLLFLHRISGINNKQIPPVLHMVQTYGLECLLVLSALSNDNPVEYLQQAVENETDKDMNTIVREMQDANCPQGILTVLEDVLSYLEIELPEYALLDLSQEDIENGKRMIKSLDFANPDINILKKVLITMSVAVQDCSTITITNGSEEEKIQGYFPRLTQLAGLLMLLLPQLAGEKGCLLEIGTGEGKSCILAMFAVIHAIRGTKVDIVTSSPVLARRDKKEWRKLFDMFGVTSSVVPPPFLEADTPEKCENSLQQAYNKQIVYGTVGAFAADILKQEFEKKTTRGHRNFELVIVDEVDYMTLDHGVQVTFLSHDSSGLRHVEQVLASIWTMTSACRPIEMLETGEIKWVTRLQHFHKATMAAFLGSETSENFSAYDILLPGLQLGFYSEEDIETLKQAENKEETEDEASDFQGDKWKAIESIISKIGVSQQYDLLTVFESVMENKVSFECYSVENNKARLFGTQKEDSDVKISMLLLENGQACEIMSEKLVIEATVGELQKKIKYSTYCPSKDETQKFIVIPSFLKKYIESQLPVFVENALKAIQMTQGREYMIDISPSAQRANVIDTDKHHSHAIIPVDFKSSGVLEKNKRWGNGLQQFLEMKHQLAISQLSNVTNYMSNFHYFKRYLKGNGIFGVSGTLGGDADKAFLKKQYQTETYAIPSHRHKKVVELPAVQVKGGSDLWIQTLCETVLNVANKGQVVLVICEDVRTADVLHKKLQDEEICLSHPITMYTISERHNIEKKTFHGGSIIIATNLGGRGTDVKVEREVNQCGGLFVLLTYFPQNRRVERQIFGRTGRKGNPGMVQMILNSDYLAPAYQGQSVETMRHLREEYEVKRIRDMEDDELLEIEMKEKLFSKFCRFLDDFDNRYEVEEKYDISTMELGKIPKVYQSHHPKFDYQPALNALKESWALWLTLHEEQISNHDDIETLEADLLREMENTGDMLLNGKSNNFYDYIKQAIIRTDLHCRNKSKSDYGALSYWQDVAESDPFYNAVALYNQAYITINLSEGDYKAKARRYLKDAENALDVHVSETTNTQVSVHISSTSNFEPHNKDANNFQAQMEARMNIFKSWKEYIQRAIKKLDELEKSNDDAVAEDSSVYALSEDKNFIVMNELVALYEYGLGIVFEVKRKPRFCFDALICFILGVIQVIAGILVCALSFGTASQFGLGLISEGVSDMINGIEGMIKGTFDWASWAISKSISIGMALLSAGFSTIKKVVTTGFKVTKGLLTGTKSFSSLADDVLQSGKKLFLSLKGAAKQTTSSFSKQAFGSTVKKLSSSTAVKQNFKHASRYALQELGKEAANSALNYLIDEGVQAFFKTILQSSFKDTVTSAVKQNDQLALALTDFISSSVPKAALEKEPNDFKINKKYERVIQETVDTMTDIVISDLMIDCTTAHDVINKLTDVCEKATDIMEQARLPGVTKGLVKLLEAADYTSRFVECLSSVPTKKIIDKTLVPKLLERINEVQLQMGESSQDERRNLPDVKRLKDDLLCNIAEKVSQAFIESCSGHITNIMTKSFKRKLNKATGKAVGNVLGKYKTQSFFDDQRHKHNMKSASHKKDKTLSESEEKELKSYLEDISNVNHAATAFDIYVLTKSDLIQGKGIRLIVCDKHGRRLSEECYPGMDNSAGEITLRLTKQPVTTRKRGIYSWIKKRVLGEREPYLGHFDIIQANGKVIQVKSDKQNCLYHAIVLATSNNPEDVKQEAVRLREKVKNEVKLNFKSYTQMLRLQKGYDETHKNPGKYAITGGIIQERDKAKEARKKHQETLKSFHLSKEEHEIIKAYNLGYVDNYKCVTHVRNTSENNGNNNRKRTVNADHIPPKNSIKMAWQCIQANPERREELKTQNPGLYNMLQSSENDQLAMEVFKSHHMQALTTGRSKESTLCRELITESLVGGDTEKMLKHSLILANPQMSQQLKRDAGVTLKPQQHIMTTQKYYKIGYTSVVEIYFERGVIDQNQKERLSAWVHQDKYLSNETPEYQEILKKIRRND